MPTGFGLNVIVRSADLPDEARGRIASASLTVTGDQPFGPKPLDAVAALKSGEARFRYLPTIHQGTLRLSVDVLDGSGTLIAHGDSEALTLQETAVNTTITLIVGGAPDMATGADMATAPPDLTVLPDLTQPKKQGDSCSSSIECGTAGGCVDGYCCDQACNMACSACNVTGHFGTCVPIPTGGSPATGHPTCGPDDKSTCKRNGVCDGLGACQLWPISTVCKPASCDATTNMVTGDSKCDGNGACKTPAATICAPYVCNATSCWSSCTGTAQCSSGNVCSGGSCGLKPDGASCTAGSECQHGNCVDTVCCDTPCTGLCSYCNSAASPGKCTVAAQGTDPRNQCPAAAGGDQYCTPGGCNGAGQCQKSPLGTPCAGACSGGAPINYTCDSVGKCSISTSGSACSICKNCMTASTSAACVNAPNTIICVGASCDGNHTITNTSYCDGNGSCPQPTYTDCGLYKCITASPPSCYTSCGCCYLGCNGPHPEFCVSGSCGSTCSSATGSRYLCN